MSKVTYEEVKKEVCKGTNWGFEVEGSTFTTNKEFLENLITNEPERIKKYLFGIEE